MCFRGICGDAAANGFTVSASAGVVLGFSFSGTFIPAGSGTLVENVDCDTISGIVVSGSGGTTLESELVSDGGDDGSADDTYEAADKAGAHVIRHHTNIGKGEALRTLFKFAIHSKNDIIVTIDGDGQFLPEEIPKLVRDIEEEKSDIVIGYRFDDATDMPNYRRFGNKILDKTSMQLVL